jgi:hypothetical protein
MNQIPALPKDLLESEMSALQLFYQQEQAGCCLNMFSVIQPVVKEFLTFGPKGFAFQLEKRGLEAWMVTQALCRKVRQYFLAIGHLVLQSFVWLTKSTVLEIPAIENLQEDDNWVLFPLNAIFLSWPRT